MKKILKFVSSVLFLLILCLSVFGCNQSNDPKDLLVGKWAPVGASGVWMEFKSDETFGIGYVYNGKESFYSIGTYKINDSTLSLKSNGENSNVTFFDDSDAVEAPYSLKDGKLTITIDGKTETYEKYTGTSDESRSTVDDIVNKANESTYKINAASIDAACKNYYAEVVVGTVNNSNPCHVTVDRLPDRGAKASEKKSVALKCTVYGALEYAGLTSIAGELSNYCSTGYAIEYKPVATGTIIVSEITRNTTMSELFGIKDNGTSDSIVSQTSVTEIDPFENLSFTYTGVSPYIAVATDISRCSDTVQNYVDFQLSKSENVRNGDTITVTAVCDDRLFNAGYTLSNTSKDYTMQDLPEFIKLVDGLDLKELQSQMDDKRDAFTATNDGASKFADCWLSTGNEGFDSVKSTVLKSTYLLSLKNSFEDKHINDGWCYNRYIQIYEYVINRKNNADPVKIFVVIYADNVYKDNTGKVFWDYQIGAQGYDNYNNLVNEYITKEKEFYNSTEI